MAGSSPRGPKKQPSGKPDGGEALAESMTPPTPGAVLTTDDDQQPFIETETEEWIANGYLDIEYKELRSPSEWRVRFRVDDYLGNPRLIEKLNEEKMAATHSWVFAEKRLAQERERAEALAVKYQQLEVSVSRLELSAQQAARASTLTFYLGVAGAISLGCGTNLITGSKAELGLLLIFIGVTLEFVAYRTSAPGATNGQ